MRMYIVMALAVLSASLYAAAPVSKEVLLGKFTPSDNESFVRIDSRYTDKSNIYMQREAYEAYLRMRSAAAEEGIDLVIVSATRNFDSQMAIWNRKWQRLSGTDSVRVREIMRYSSMPGTSRHHWGTDVDFISVETAYWKKGYGLRVYKWLCENAVRYGFYQPYTADPKRTGYAEERWHWSYYPISRQYTALYPVLISPEDIVGFSGADLVVPLNVVATHVLGIAPVPDTDPQMPAK